MDNKEFISVLKKLKEMTEDSQLAKYIEDRIIDLYHEMEPEETWLDRLKKANNGEYSVDHLGAPTICLGDLLGYEHCLCLVNEKEPNCLECWKTSVREIDTLKEW